MTVMVSRSMSSSECASGSFSWLRLCAERSARLRLLREAVERRGRLLVLAWEAGVSVLAGVLAGVLAFSYAVITKPRFLLGWFSATLVARPSA